MEPSDNQVIEIIQQAAEGKSLAISFLGWMLRQVSAWEPRARRSFHQSIKKQVLRFVYLRARGAVLAMQDGRRNKPTGGGDDAAAPNQAIRLLPAVKPLDCETCRQEPQGHVPLKPGLPTVARQQLRRDRPRQVSFPDLTVTSPMSQLHIKKAKGLERD